MTKTSVAKPSIEAAKTKGKAKLDVAKKIETIAKSRMPDSQKKELIAKLRGEKSEGGIPFAVYSTIRAIRPDIKKAMLVWPKAKGKIKENLTTMEWDKLFKGF